MNPLNTYRYTCWNVDDKLLQLGKIIHKREKLIYDTTFMVYQKIP